MAGDRISEIVGAVKSYAYLDQAPVQRIDVRKGLDDTLVILRHKLKAGIEVTRDYDPDLPEIEAWGSELNQVWTNLIDNAADAMDGEGAISIRAERRRRRRGPGHASATTGPASRPRSRPRSSSRSSRPSRPGIGSGLGLHISHNVVVRHGGRIDLESEPGRTCFIVTLPITLPPGGSRHRPGHLTGLSKAASTFGVGPSRCRGAPHTGGRLHSTATICPAPHPSSAGRMVLGGPGTRCYVRVDLVRRGHLGGFAGHRASFADFFGEIVKPGGQDSRDHFRSPSRTPRSGAPRFRLDWNSSRLIDARRSRLAGQRRSIRPPTVCDRSTSS